GKKPRFQTPKFIFATEQSHQSNRPVETITPLSLALGLSINSSFPDSAAGIQRLANVMQGPMYGQQVVLICWHHGTIPKLATALVLLIRQNGRARYLIWCGRSGIQSKARPLSEFTIRSCYMAMRSDCSVSHSRLLH